MISREIVGTVAVVALLVLAGCFGGASPTPTPTPTDGDNGGINPSTGTNEGAPDLAPPGIPGGTLENVTALLSAHESALVDRGFVAEARSADRTFRYAVASTGGTRLIDASDGTTAIWTNGSASVARLPNDDGAQYARPSESTLSDGGMTRVSRLRALLTAGRYDRTGTTDCGETTCVVLTAERSTSERYRNFSVTVHVEESGVIRSLDAEYVLAENGVETDYAFSVRQVGNVTVERPDWVAEGLDSLD